MLIWFEIFDQEAKFAWHVLKFFLSLGEMIYAIPVDANLIILALCFSITEKARIEAQVKAAEAAAQRKLDEEIRMKREQEREAARLALRMVLPTCHFLASKFICLVVGATAAMAVKSLLLLCR